MYNILQNMGWATFEAIFHPKKHLVTLPSRTNPSTGTYINNLVQHWRCAYICKVGYTYIHSVLQRERKYFRDLGELPSNLHTW
jgi:hypothetical protein